MWLAARPPPLFLALLTLPAALALSACSDDGAGSPLADAALADGSVADAALADGGPCDAAPVYGCVPDCPEGEVCVAYESESGFQSCTSYFACVATALDCPPGTCTADCEAALCPDPYACIPTDEGQLYTCSKP
jgi:hypothetical protein